MSTYGALLGQAIHALTEKGIDNPVFQAKQLVMGHFDLTSVALASAKKTEIDNTERQTLFLEKVNRVIEGEPLQYILGEWEFMGLPFIVGEGVLIPRPETEALCELAVAFIKGIAAPVVFDLCAGSGCIGISVAKLCPNAKVFLFEKSPMALRYCQENIQRNHAQNVELVSWDVFEKYDPNCMADVILSNPPYIPTRVLPTLQTQVQQEPPMALDGGEDGLSFYRIIAAHWLNCLRPGGLLGVEHGEEQAEQVMRLFASGLTSIRSIPDLAGLDRLVTGKRKENP